MFAKHVMKNATTIGGGILEMSDIWISNFRRAPIETGIEEGIEWAIYINPVMGGTNGYARIPKGHIWRGLTDWQWECTADVNVHGGVTYGITDEGWIGFDTSHYRDVWEGSGYLLGTGESDDIHWDQDKVIEETKSLARQIASVNKHGWAKLNWLIKRKLRRASKWLI